MTATMLLLGALALQAREATPGVTFDTSILPEPFTYVAGMARAGDGSILVLDPPQKSILRFTAQGRFLGSIGREGAGPGEFRWPLGLGSLGELTWVADAQLLRVTMFDRTMQLDTTLSLKRFGQVALVAGGGHVIQPTPDEVRPGTDRTNEELTLVLVRPDGPEQRIGRWVVDGNPIAVRGEVGGRGFIIPATQPFTDHALWAVSPDGRSITLVEADSGGGSPSLVSLDVSGKPRFRTQLKMPRQRLTDAMFKRGVDSLIEYLREPRPGTGGPIAVDEAWVRAKVNRPLDVSPVTQILAGADGRAWLRLRTSSRPGSTEWRAYTAAGAPVAAVLIPSKVRVLLFTATSAWGASETADGEPVVVEYVLPK